MARIKNPLLSLKAIGKIGNITFRRSRKQTIAEVIPIPVDAKSPGQLAWRPMFLKCVDLWHTLSAAEKQIWESQARSRRMTGYAWYLSQCLRPNPGIYLPLQGGTMQGEIDIAGYHLHGLPAPTHVNDAARKAYVDAKVALATYTAGALVFHTINQTIPNTTETTLVFDSEVFDTDVIHDNAVNNDRLTCKTPGKYLVQAGAGYLTSAVGRRRLRLYKNGARQATNTLPVLAADFSAWIEISTTVELAVGEYMTIASYQSSGGNLDILGGEVNHKRFSMQRIG